MQYIRITALHIKVVWKTKQMATRTGGAKTAKKLEVLDIFCDQWNPRIIAALRNDGRRFLELQRALGINSATLSAKLKNLEAAKVVEKNAHTIDKLSVTYRLTALGSRLLPIYDQIEAFSLSHRARRQKGARP